MDFSWSRKRKYKLLENDKKDIRTITDNKRKQKKIKRNRKRKIINLY
jgi:hypothetical protein